MKRIFFLVFLSFFLNQFVLAIDLDNEEDGIYCPALSKPLKKGFRDTNTGGQVSELQNFLSDYFDLEPTQLLTSGIFGNVTHFYVKKFQTENNLISTGIVGLVTRNKISQVCNIPQPGQNGVSTSTIQRTNNINPLQCPVLPVPVCSGELRTLNYFGCNFYSCTGNSLSTSTIPTTPIVVNPPATTTPVVVPVLSLGTKAEVAAYLKNKFGATVTTPGGVVVLPAQDEKIKSLVILPDGSPLNIDNTKTAGIQEAFDYANRYGWDLFIYGKGRYDVTNSGGKYLLQNGIKFGPVQGKTIRIYDADLVFDSTVTGSALEFDSSMMLDFKHTGKIEATSANNAVYFNPENPHPLDGVIYGTRGIVASRFVFGDLYAKSSPVLIETDTSTGLGASWNGNSFYAKSYNNQNGVVAKPLNVVGEKYSHSFVKKNPPTEKFAFTPDPFVLNSVVVMPPNSKFEKSKIYNPDGTEVMQDTTKTHGVQEAINRANALNTNLVIYGRGLKLDKIAFNPDGTRNDQPGFNDGFYYFGVPVIFSNTSNKAIKIFNTTLVTNFADTENGAMLNFRGSQNLDFEFTGQLVNKKSDSVKFEPALGTDISNSVFKIGSAGSVGISAYFSNIKNNEFYFTELLGKGSDIQSTIGDGSFGVKIYSPSTGTCICFNKIEGNFVHGHTVIGVQVGHVAQNSDNVNNNALVFNIDSDTQKSIVGLQLWAKYNSIVANVAGNYDRGISIEPTAKDNIIKYESLSGKESIFNGSTFTNTSTKITRTIGNYTE